MIILDTDVLIEIFDKRSVKGDEALRVLAESGEDIATTVINLHEVLYGLEKYAKPVRDILLLPVIEYTKRDAQLSAELELKAESLGKPVRRADAIIAAITLNRGAQLYTFDLKHFNIFRNFGLKLLVQ
ncbi:type II toxin-antitoxin system VapC family toxin [Candidatus Bathyarchaeota archaeon]|nr:type II toxin-antitoxin system VapC family toxin [Candidatus Bathyarchaeota archaeon]